MNKKSYLARVRLPRTPADWLEAMMNFIFFLCGMLAVGCVVLISVYMVVSGVPAIHKIGLFRFLLGTEWASTAADPKFGILPFILSSIYGTLGATLIGVPVGLLTAVFLSKAADPKVRTVVVTAIELLSGIPSVVFGLLGMQVLVPAVAKTFGKASGACLLSAIVVLSIMILPSIVSVSVTALNAVPPEYEQGSLALGATDTETWFKISVPAAKSGIAAGIVLGIGRAPPGGTGGGGRGKSPPPPHRLRSQLSSCALHHCGNLRLRPIADRFGNGLSILEYDQHRDAGYLKTHCQLHLLVHIDLAHLEGTAFFFGKLMQYGREHFARSAPVRIEIQQDGLVGMQYLIFKIRSSNFQFSHEKGSVLLSLFILCFSACKCPASWFPSDKTHTMCGACRAP